MFCPKCATQNMEGARFCRSCGADISMVPMAMSGKLPQVQPHQVQMPAQLIGRRGRPVSYESAFGHLGVGIAMLVVALMVLLFGPAGKLWWFWLLIPAITTGVKGIGQLARIKHETAHAQLPMFNSLPVAAAIPPPTFNAALPSQAGGHFATGDLMPQPPSVSEGTTRHLGSEGPTRVFEPANPGDRSQ
jgi:zinc-ribbon domain